MLNKTTLLAGLVLLCPTLFSVLEKPDEKLEYKLVWEKEFDKEIRDVAWSQTDDGNLYPKIIVFEDEVRFHDEETEAIASVRVPSGTWMTRISKKGTYVLVEKAVTPSTKIEPGEKKVEVYNDKGTLISEMEAPIGWEVAPYYYVSSNGSTVEVENGWSTIRFIDSVGKELRKVDVFEDTRWSRDPFKGDFSEDGSFFAVQTSKWLFSEPPKQHSWLLLFSTEGKELWRKPLHGKKSKEIWVSPAGSLLMAAVTDNNTNSSQFMLFDGYGEPIAQYPNEDSRGVGGSKCSFSSNERYVSAGQGNSFYLIEAKTGKVVWSKRLLYETDPRQKRYGSLESILTTNEGEVTASVIEWEKSHLVKREILIIGVDGEVKHKIQSSYGKRLLTSAVFTAGTELASVGVTTVARWRTD